MVAKTAHQLNKHLLATATDTFRLIKQEKLHNLLSTKEMLGGLTLAFFHRPFSMYTVSLLIFCLFNAYLNFEGIVVCSGIVGIF